MAQSLAGAPLQGSLGLSAVVAAFPIFVLFYLLEVRRKPSWVAGLSGLGATIGFGTPMAVASAMLAGLGFSPFYAAAICLLAKTAPVAFGFIAIPVVTLAAVTGLPLDRLSAGVGRICAPMSLFIPATSSS